MTKEQLKYLDEKPYLKNCFNKITEEEITRLMNMPLDKHKRNSNEEKVLKTIVNKMVKGMNLKQAIDLWKDFTIRFLLRWY